MIPVPVDENGKQLRELLDGVRRDVRQDGDEVIVVTGRERSGKSTLAFHAANYVDPTFSVDDQVAFNADQYTRLAVKLPKYRALVLDEATDGAYSRMASSPANIKLTKFLTVAGARNLIHFICWPNIRWLDPILKEHRCRYNLHVLRRYRGHAVAQVRLLQQDERILDPPRVLFPFSYPPADGPAWQAYKARKDAYVTDVGQGEDVVTAMRAQARDSMRLELRGLIGEI